MGGIGGGIAGYLSPAATTTAAAAAPSAISPEAIAAANATADPIAALNASQGWTGVDQAYLASIGGAGAAAATPGLDTSGLSGAMQTPGAQPTGVGLQMPAGAGTATPAAAGAAGGRAGRHGDARGFHTVGPCEEFPHEVGPDEARGTGDEITHQPFSLSLRSHSCASAKSASVTPARRTGVFPSCRG